MPKPKPIELTDAQEEFLIGLEALTRKTGLELCGCGCCGSPYLTPLKEKNFNPTDGYSVTPNGDYADCVEWGRRYIRKAPPTCPPLPKKKAGV